MSIYVFSGLAFFPSFEKISDINLDRNYYNENEGNFMGMVKLLSGENEEIKKHLEYSKEYAMITKELETKGRGYHLTFLSPNFVRKVLTILRQHVTQKTVNEINDSGGYYAIEVDNSQDCTRKEQCAVVLRYVNETSVYERLGLILNIKDSSGKGMFDTVGSALKAIGLSKKK